MQTLRLLIVCAVSLAFSGWAAAQSATKSPEKSATKSSAHKKKSAVKEAEPDVVATPPPAADEEQLVAAALTLFGQYDCEYDQKLMVSRNPSANGYVDVSHGKRIFTMKPVRSPTGAVRLEEVSGSMLMVQIPSKSMLMDTKLGKRVVDACKSDEQRKEIESADSLGISAPGQMALGSAATPAAKAR
ncbi:MAG: hypothetical protein ABIR94_16175 [Rubrivivax sp.]